MQTYGRFPLELVRGRGVWVWDSKGKRYLDGVAGIAVCTLGHSSPVMRRALGHQLRKLQHVSNLYRIPEQEQLAAWITANSCADAVFFCNSGAEAMPIDITPPIWPCARRCIHTKNPMISMTGRKIDRIPRNQLLLAGVNL